MSTHTSLSCIFAQTKHSTPHCLSRQGIWPDQFATLGGPGNYTYGCMPSENIASTSSASLTSAALCTSVYINIASFYVTWEAMQIVTCVQYSYGHMKHQPSRRRCHVLLQCPSFLFKCTCMCADARSYIQLSHSACIRTCIQHCSTHTHTHGYNYLLLVDWAA
jgi:hypothetical protein